MAQDLLDRDRAPEDGPEATSTGEPPDPIVRALAKKRFTTAVVVGGLLGAIAFGWMVSAGTFDFTQWQKVGSFYDAQAESWLDGHWDIEQKILGIESFGHEGRTYMYQGPWPALLRVPVFAVTDSFYGRLTALSMLAAFAVAVVFSARLLWKLRNIIRPRAPVRNGEFAFTVFFMFVLGGGSSLLYTASRAWVYHEAIMWGVALSIAAFDAILGFYLKPSPKQLAWVAFFSIAAISSRASIGLGPVAAVGLLTLGLGVAWLRKALVARRPDHNEPRWVTTWGERLAWLSPRQIAGNPRYFVAAAVVCLLPVVSYAAVNYMKFESLFSIPFWEQNFSIVDRGRQAFLEENDGTLFGLKFIPTTALQYLRPDALSFTGTFPFVDFPPFPGRVIGGFKLDLFDRSSSIPSSLPFWVALTAPAVYAVVRPARTAARRALSVVRVPLLGAAAGALTLLPFGYISNRYIADAFPFLVIGGGAGMYLLWRYFDDKDLRVTTWWIRPAVACLVVLGLFTVWTNTSLALLFQRAYSPNVPEERIAGWIDTTHAVNSALGIDDLSNVAVGDELPDSGSSGDLFIIGDCDGMYLSDGQETNDVKWTNWNAVERTPETGRFVFEATFEEQPAGTREPILVSGTPEQPDIVWMRHLGDGQVIFGYDGEPFEDLATTRDEQEYLPIDIDFDKTYTLDLVMDPRVSSILVRLDDELVFETFYTGPREVTVGENVVGYPDVTPTLSADLEELPVQTPVCDELLAELDQSEAGRAPSS
ncbi:MAG: hypothetical protein R3A49_01560 [Acidimicrobiia bacterium]